MCNAKQNTRICIVERLFHCQQPHEHIHLKEKKKVLQYTNSKILFLKGDFHILKISG